MKITWFGHSAFRIDTGKSVILIDPFLSGSPVYDGSVEDAAKGCTHVVLTHGHDDHTGDTVAICKDTGATLIAQFELCKWLAAKGAEKFDPTNKGGTVDHGDFTASFTHAYHSSGTMEDGASVYLGSPCGVVIKAEDHSVYHMGDTEIFGDMALINEIHQPDIGMVPIGDRFTMGGEVAALACNRYFEFETVIPCHFGTFPILDQGAEKFIEAMGKQPVKVMAVGESIEV